MGKASPHYSDFGDNYEVKDPLKVLAIKAATATANNLQPLGFKEITQSRGESTHVIDVGPFYLASNPEGLGTKNLISDEMSKHFPNKHFYKAVAKDTVASIVNDLITLGAQPLVVNAHWSMGDNDWLKDQQRWADLVTGWSEACTEAGAIYGAGESPTLKGIIQSGKIELSGSVMGMIKPKKHLTLGKKLKAGDRIILIESNGIQANGLSMARGLVEKQPKQYLTKLSNGQTIGEALLKPSHIYAKLVAALFEAKIDIHYMVHMTGHGWSKLMRYVERPFSYHVDTLPTVQEEFSALQKFGKLSDEVMYGTFNMGTGYAIFVPEKYADAVIDIAQKSYSFKSWDAGSVNEGERQVIIEPLQLTYSADTLNLR